MQGANGLSMMGRMGYWAHMMVYPTMFVMWRHVYVPMTVESEKAAKKAEWDKLVPARKVDPDLFNPFSPVPYHNNPELPYVYSHINMRNYVNENHINPKEYVWKAYFDSYDHNNKRTYQYNWTLIQ